MDILFPVFAMVLITFAVGPLILSTRVRSVREGVVRIEYYEIFRGGEPPADVLKTTRHLSNLYEAPLLFYVACLLAFSLHMDNTLMVGLAWAYVAARLVHTMIHLTYNRVFHRLTAFSVSQIILLVMWILLFIEVI